MPVGNDVLSLEKNIEEDNVNEDKVLHLIHLASLLTRYEEFETAYFLYFEAFKMSLCSVIQILRSDACTVAYLVLANSSTVMFST